MQLLAPVAPDQQRRNRLDATTDEPNHVERRLIAPVKVLEAEHRGLG